jgi:hypothetical protein
LTINVDEDEDENEYPPGAHASGGSHFLIVTISTDDTDETDGRALHLRLYCTAKKSMALVIAIVTQDILGISKSLFERPWHILDILIYLYFQGCEALEQGIVDILYVLGLYA